LPCTCTHNTIFPPGAVPLGWFCRCSWCFCIPHTPLCFVVLSIARVSICHTAMLVFPQQGCGMMTAGVGRRRAGIEHATHGQQLSGCMRAPHPSYTAGGCGGSGIWRGMPILWIHDVALPRLVCTLFVVPTMHVGHSPAGSRLPAGIAAGSCCLWPLSVVSRLADCMLSTTGLTTCMQGWLTPVATSGVACPVVVRWLWSGRGI
jgi:hypothetical protein